MINEGEHLAAVRDGRLILSFPLRFFPLSFPSRIGITACSIGEDIIVLHAALSRSSLSIVSIFFSLNQQDAIRQTVNSSHPMCIDHVFFFFFFSPFSQYAVQEGIVDLIHMIQSQWFFFPPSSPPPFFPSHMLFKTWQEQSIPMTHDLDNTNFGQFLLPLYLPPPLSPISKSRADKG